MGLRRAVRNLKPLLLGAFLLMTCSLASARVHASSFRFLNENSTSLNNSSATSNSSSSATECNKNGFTTGLGWQNVSCNKSGATQVILIGSCISVTIVVAWSLLYCCFSRQHSENSSGTLQPKFRNALSFMESSFRGIQVAMPGDRVTTHVAMPEPSPKEQIPSPESSTHNRQAGLYATWMARYGQQKSSVANVEEHNGNDNVNGTTPSTTTV